VSEIALPVVIHAGHPTTGHTEGADVAPLGVVADRWPEVRLIVAHCGHPAGAAVLDLVAAHPQVYADLTPVVHELVEVDRARLAELAGKILFGSDAPNTGVTAGQALAHLDGLDPVARAEITGGTARRLQAAIRT
jgi:predicted TIM-barrel fold metal-dependent hydrolase